jgi:hypothetical protein
MSHDRRRRRSPKQLLAVLLALTGCSFSEPSTSVSGVTVLPLEPFLVPMVRGAVPGRDAARFVIDTGASMSLLDEADTASWGLAIHSYVIPRLMKGGHGHGMITHYTSPEDTGALELVLGAVSIRFPEIPVIDLHAIAKESSGILGQDILSRLVVLFEPKPRQLSIMNHADWRSRLAIAAETRWSPLPFRWEQGLPIVDLVLKSGTSVPMLIDTGCELSMITPEAAREMGLTALPGQFHLGGSVGGPYGGALYELPVWKLGEWEVSTVVGENQTLDHGLLGFDVLGDVSFAFDGPGATLWIAAPNSDEERQIESWTSKAYQLMRNLSNESEEQGRSDER